jgi:hypothetical protein
MPSGERSHEPTDVTSSTQSTRNLESRWHSHCGSSMANTASIWCYGLAVPSHTVFGETQQSLLLLRGVQCD